MLKPNPALQLNQPHTWFLEAYKARGLQQHLVVPALLLQTAVRGRPAEAVVSVLTLAGGRNTAACSSLPLSGV